MIKIRQEVFDTYWMFAAKRQDAFFNRLLRKSPPWSDDPILQEYKFCNTYRASDRVSQYLIRNVIYSGSENEDDVVFRILLFKIFNKIETWQYLEERFGTIELASFSFETYSALLQEAMDRSETIYTSAYMSCATKAYGYDRKHENHLRLIEQMLLHDKITAQITQCSSMEEVYRILLKYPLIGKFMAYQLATDLNYSGVINFDEDEFTVPGPGAERGIKKCFEDTGGRNGEEIIRWMAKQQKSEFERLGICFKSLWGRSLHLIDCQGLFCETDKYSRVAFPNLKSNRVRIKAKFEPNMTSIKYFYPPKWGINDRIRETISTVPTVPSESDHQSQLVLVS